ncbi:hypothetical protein [Gimesia algae]|uniref:Lipocalin-like domain-containing protein n=1 Tax=Gimesia algae TaxID=2527971 RepID=A0A517VBT2_9PLAN|nr:hypothetical protein [Gimesia algae]QDT90439.1 hypothetical protein Pan161_20910 [Gimesia algae]
MKNWTHLNYSAVVLLSLVCLASSCQKSERDLLVGRWQNSSGPNMIFNKDGSVYSVHQGQRRKGAYYLDMETKPKQMVLDMRKTEINAVLFFDFNAFSEKHFELTPTYVQRTGGRKRKSDLSRKLLFQKIDPNDPTMGINRFSAEATPTETP